MTPLEIASVVGGAVTMVGGIVKYADNKYQKLQEEIQKNKEDSEKRINDLEKKALLGDEKIKGHINSCVNFKKRENHID